MRRALQILGAAVLLCTQRAGSAQFCLEEVAQIQCPFDHVILMTAAAFGRMKLGRCVQQGFGYLGCQSDRMHVLNRTCSGRRNCSLSVIELRRGEQGCPGDLTAYLDASWQCQQVQTCRRRACDESGPVPAAASYGRLSSEVTRRTGCGSLTCPWQLPVEQGQSVHFRLDPWDKPGKSGVCHRYAEIRDGASLTRDLTWCSGRDVTQATSGTLHLKAEVGSLSVVLFASKDTTGPHFIVTYNVTGCADPSPPPPDSWWQRRGLLATVHCNATEQKWHVRCVDGKWQGHVGRCQKKEQSAWVEDSDSPRSSSFVLIVVGLGVALGVILGTLLLVASLCYLRKRASCRRHQHIESRQNVYFTELDQSVRADYGSGAVYKHPRHVIIQHEPPALIMTDTWSDTCPHYSPPGDTTIANMVATTPSSVRETYGSSAKGSEEVRCLYHQQELL